MAPSAEPVNGISTTAKDPTAITPPPAPPSPWIKTPLVLSTALSRIAGCKVYLKLENLQPSGSFKCRGIGNLILHHLHTRPPTAPSPHFYSSSGGNAGLACVHAARSLGYPATIIVPQLTTPFMIAKLRAAGAHAVEQHGATWAEADRYLRDDVLGPDNAGGRGVYIPPFDHDAIWEGNGSLVHEVVEQLAEMDGGAAPLLPDAMVCSVGGGGLFCGLMRGLDSIAPSAATGGRLPQDVHVIAVETAGADSLAQSLAADAPITLAGITSIATSLGATRVCDRAFADGRRDTVRSVVMADAEAARACVRFVEDERCAVEVGCGAAVAMAYRRGWLGEVVGGREGRAVLVVCGGANVSVAKLAEWEREFGGHEEDGEEV
ncbi:MAG: catabolic L-serine/threonine dehydratase [Piccolia ochrophora]|nr:MAG: catabolic L-serine/threonine dehydratase [Piccolia ochrophora]